MHAHHRFTRCWIGVLSLALMTLAVVSDSQNGLATATPIATSTTEPSPESITPPSAADNTETLAAIATSQVIYLGETHTDLNDHLAQLEIVEALATQSDIAIGLEMFQRPFQSVLNSYLADEITETALIEQSEYETRWGYDWEFYAPIIRYAKENQIPLIALNTPAEVTRQVAQSGLASLSGEALTYIPPIDEIDTTDAAYRDAIAAVFNAHGGAGHSSAFENFFAAQVLWDETMAQRIVTQLEADPEKQVVVLVGEGHIAYDYGIPNRVERRIPDVAQASVRLVPSTQEIEPEFADFLWITPE
ncbi:MAG: ChaN family lipoprotein [Phormidesmis sp.]